MSNRRFVIVSGASYRSLAFLDTYSRRDFTPADRRAIKKALRLLDASELQCISRTQGVCLQKALRHGVYAKRRLHLRPTGGKEDEH